MVSYKTIYINTYNVTVMDISNPDVEQTTLFRHESFQLWESEVRGFMLTKTHDFITLNKSGLSIIALGAIEKKEVVNQSGQEMLIHSLESVNYLKVDRKNFVLFKCAEEEKVIEIQQEFEKGDKKLDAEETEYDLVYGIKLHDITLRELLLFQSLYVCKTQSEIV